jgi:hypothetical protein
MRLHFALIELCFAIADLHSVMLCLAAAVLAAAGPAATAGLGGLAFDLLFHLDSPSVQEWTNSL